MLWIWVFALGAVSTAFAVPLASNSGLAKALTGLSELKGFSTPFKQVLSYAEGGEREYSGQLSVLRPGKFSWRYLKPYEQLFVSNGDGIWLYEPDLMQAQKLQDLGEIDPVVMQLLDGRIGLEAVNTLDKQELADVDVWHVRIGKEQQVTEVWLGVENGTLRWLESRDVLMNKNRLYLLDIDKKLPAEDKFEFIAPEGVDVIGAK